MSANYQKSYFNQKSIEFKKKILKNVEGHLINKNK